MSSRLAIDPGFHLGQEPANRTRSDPNPFGKRIIEALHPPLDRNPSNWKDRFQLPVTQTHIHRTHSGREYARTQGLALGRGEVGERAGSVQEREASEGRNEVRHCLLGCFSEAGVHCKVMGLKAVASIGGICGRWCG